MITKNYEYRVKTINDVVFMYNSEKSFEINEFGYTIWKEISSNKEIVDIIKNISKIYKIDKPEEYDQLSLDINMFLNDLRSKGIVYYE